MKKLFIIFLLLFAASAVNAQESKPVAQARQNLAALRACKDNHVLGRYNAIVEMVLPEQIGTSYEELRAIASDCLEQRFHPLQLIANIRNNLGRSKSLVKLEEFFRESGTHPAELGLTPAEIAEVAKVARMRLEMLGRSLTFPTWYPRR